MLQNLGEGLNYFYLREARAYLVFRNYITTVRTNAFQNGTIVCRALRGWVICKPRK